MTAGMGERGTALTKATRVLAGCPEDTGGSWCPNHKRCTFFGASPAPPTKNVLTVPAHLPSPSLNSSEHLLSKPHFRTNLFSFKGSSLLQNYTKHPQSSGCGHFPDPECPQNCKLDLRSLCPSYTRSCGKQTCGLAPISPTWAQENRGSSDEWATIPRTALTRLSIHREGH